MRVVDLLAEAVAGIFARPGRTVLTVLGTVLGIGALVATLGVAKTAGNQIVGRFDELAATSVVVTNEQGFFGGVGPRVAIPADAEERLTRLNGVAAAGALGSVDVQGALVRSVPIPDPLAQTEFQISIYAATPGLLGAGAALRLNVTRVDQQPVVFVGEEPFVVMGILEGWNANPNCSTR